MNSKLYALGRRATYKDYVDLYFIVREKHCSLSSIIVAAKKIYGKIPSNLPNTDMLKKNDETIISSFWMNESLNQYAQKLDEAGKAAQEEASRPYVSSLQAQKMTARTLGALLQALAQMQKNEAQNLGLKNRQEKLASEEFLEHSNEISNALRMTNNTTSLVRLK